MPDIRYTFVASRQESVVAAFRAIDAAAEKAGRSAEAAGRKFSSRRRFRGEGVGGRPVELKEAAQVAAAEKSKTSAVQRESAKRVRILEAEERRRKRLFEAGSERQIRELRSRLDKEARAEQAAIDRRARAADRARRRSGRQLGALAGTIGQAALYGGAALVGAGLGVAGRAARESVALEDRATMLAIKGRTQVSGRALLGEASQVARDVKGVKTEDVLAGTEAFVAKTGRLDIGRDLQKVLSGVSLATGTAQEDLGRVAADLFEKFDIQTVEDMNEALARLAEQGKKGAFELEDMARQFPRMAASMKRYGFGETSGKGAVAVLGGLAQIARQSTGNAQQASTAVENMFRELVTKSEKIKRETGADVFVDKGKTTARDIRNILPEIIVGAKGDKAKLQGIFGERGIRAVSPLIEMFNELRSEGVDTGKAMQLLKDRIAKAIDATGAQGRMEADIAKAQQTTGNQLTAAWERLRGSVDDQLTPAIVNFVNMILGEEERIGGFELAIGLAADALDVFAVAIDTIVGLIPGLSDSVKEARAEFARRRAGQQAELARGTMGALEERTQLGAEGAAALDVLGKRDLAEGPVSEGEFAAFDLLTKTGALEEGEVLSLADRYAKEQKKLAAAEAITQVPGPTEAEQNEQIRKEKLDAARGPVPQALGIISPLLSVPNIAANAAAVGEATSLQPLIDVLLPSTQQLIQAADNTTQAADAHKEAAGLLREAAATLQTTAFLGNKI